MTPTWAIGGNVPCPISAPAIPAECIAVSSASSSASVTTGANGHLTHVRSAAPGSENLFAVSEAPRPSVLAANAGAAVEAMAAAPAAAAAPPIN